GCVSRSPLTEPGTDFGLDGFPGYRMLWIGLIGSQTAIQLDLQVIGQFRLPARVQELIPQAEEEFQLVLRRPGLYLLQNGRRVHAHLRQGRTAGRYGLVYHILSRASALASSPPG